MAEIGIARRRPVRSFRSDGFGFDTAKIDLDRSALRTVKRFLRCEHRKVRIDVLD